MSQQTQSSSDKFLRSLANKGPSEIEIIVGWLIINYAFLLLACSPVVPLAIAWLIPGFEIEQDDTKLSLYDLPWLCLVTVPLSLTVLVTSSLSAFFQLRLLRKLKDSDQKLNRGRLRSDKLTN